MKLSGINDADHLPVQLRAIFNGQSHLAESVIQRTKNRNFPPLSYLFVESVLATGVVNEAGRLQALFQAGLAKLQAAITPGSGQDLDILLQFMAPRGGGSAAVQNLVQSAGREQGDITANDQWWKELFNAFGIADETIKGNVQNQVKQELAKGIQPEAGDEADAAEADPETGQSLEAGGSPGGGSLLDQLKDERGREQAYQGDISSQLAAIRKSREANQEAIGHLRNRLDTALKGGPNRKDEEQVAAESVSAELALALMCETAVIRNIGTVGNHMIRQIGIRCRCNTPVLSEVGLLDRLRGAVGGTVQGGRNLLANPELAKRKLRTATSSANNTRAAKLATQFLSDHLRSTFEMKLETAGLTPDAIKQKLQTWSQLKDLEKNSGGNPSPNLVKAMLSASEELKKVFKLFNYAGKGRPKKSEFDYKAPEPAAVEEPIEAELIDPGAAEPGVAQPLNRRQKTIARVASIALKMPIDDAKFAEIGATGLLEAMAGNGPWAVLAGHAKIRPRIDKELTPYADRGITADKLSPKARVIVLKRLFSKVSRG